MRSLFKDNRCNFLHGSYQPHTLRTRGGCRKLGLPKLSDQIAVCSVHLNRLHGSSICKGGARFICRNKSRILDEGRCSMFLCIMQGPQWSYTVAYPLHFTIHLIQSSKGGQSLNREWKVCESLDWRLHDGYKVRSPVRLDCTSPCLLSISRTRSPSLFSPLSSYFSS